MRRFLNILAITIVGVVGVAGFSYLTTVWIRLEWNPAKWTERARVGVIILPLIYLFVSLVIGFMILSSDDDDNDDGYGYL